MLAAVPGTLPVAVQAHPDTPRPVYATTAEALQHDFATNPAALSQRIGTAIVEVSGTVTNRVVDSGAVQLSGGSADVTAWLASDDSNAIGTIVKREHIKLRCDRIGTLVAPSARRPGVVEVRDCRLVHGG